MKLIIPTELDMKVNSKMGNQMVKESKHGQMVHDMKVNTKMALSMVKESIHGQMVHDMKVNTKMGNQMVKESKHGKMVHDMKVNGKMGNRLNGRTLDPPHKIQKKRIQSVFEFRIRLENEGNYQE